MDQISGTTSTDASTPAQDGGQPADAIAQDASQPADAVASGERQDDARPGFRSRGRARRRARFLRKARELAYRDLGGLVFNLHRFGQRNDALVLAKLNTLGKLDSELRALEHALQEREPVTVLHEAGITACPRCAAIHSSEDRFCPNCGLSMARNVELPIAGPTVPSAASPAGPAPPGPSAPAPAQPPPTPPQPPPTPATPPAASAAEQASSPAAAGTTPATAAPGSAPGGAGPSPPAPPPVTHAPVPAQPPSATAGSDQEESTAILRPNAPAP